jgi:hypothetical protein
MAEAAGTKQEQFVAYQKAGGTFSFTAREISTADWKRAGVEGQKAVRWDEANGHKVVVSELNEAALKLLENDSELNIVNG